MKWLRLPQTNDGNYMFHGKCFITTDAKKHLSQNDIDHIIADVKKCASNENGVGCLQIYFNQDTGYRIWVIDKLDMDQFNKGHFTLDQNRFTISTQNECLTPILK